MRSYTKHFLLVGLLMAFCVSFSGCMKAKVTTGKQPANETVELGWAHGFLYGIVAPINGPLKVGDQCENGVSKVYFRQTFIQGIAQSLASGVIAGFPWYNPQRITVTCAAGGSMSSVDDAPPSYLLRDSKVAASSQQLATAK